MYDCRTETQKEEKMLRRRRCALAGEALSMFRAAEVHS